MDFNTHPKLICETKKTFKQHQAMFLVAFNRVYSISRIKIFTGVGFVDQKITAFRLLFCNVKGGAYFSGYDTQSCWKVVDICVLCLYMCIQWMYIWYGCTYGR